jgi:hypothetical protein
MGEGQAAEEKFERNHIFSAVAHAFTPLVHQIAD